MKTKDDPKIIAALDEFRARIEAKQSKAGIGKRTKRRLAASKLAFRLSVWLAAKRRKLERMKRRATNQRLGGLAKRHGLDFEVVRAIHEFTGGNWKETARKCDVVMDSGFEPGPAYRPEDDEAFLKDWPDEHWLAAMTCRVPFAPSTVEMVFRVCDRDRDRTRKIVEAFARAGSVPTEDQVLRLKS
jgi:hypothetical protein